MVGGRKSRNERSEDISIYSFRLFLFLYLLTIKYRQLLSRSHTVSRYHGTVIQQTEVENLPQKGSTEYKKRSYKIIHVIKRNG